MTRSFISIVVPALNEAPNFQYLHDKLSDVFAQLDCDWELIVVDDGSSDNSLDVLTELHARDSRVKAISFTRSFGQSVAVSAGVDAASGDAVIIMDADGQDPPEVIPSMIAKWREGFRIVGGRRTRRVGEPLLKRLTAHVYYRLMRLLVGWEVLVDTGEFRLLDRAVVEAVKRCHQRDRLFRTLTTWSGFATATVEYEHAARHAGSTKYTLRKSARLAVTAITGFSNAPLRVATWTGISILLGSAAAILSMAMFALAGKSAHWGWWALASIWLLGGLQCVFLGVIGEYVGRIFTETQHRPLYVIEDYIGIESTFHVSDEG